MSHHLYDILGFRIITQPSIEIVKLQYQSKIGKSEQPLGEYSNYLVMLTRKEA